MARVNKVANKVKKITLNDLINYITGSGPIPDHFLSQEKELKKTIIYLFEAIWRRPKLVNFLSKYNLLYNDEIQKDPISFLNYLKTIIIDNNISKWDIKSDFFNFYQELNKIKELEKLAEQEQLQLIDIVGRLKTAGAIGESVKINKAKKIDKKDQKEIKETIEKVFKEQEEKDLKIKQEKLNNDSRFLKELNEKIIEDLELTIIDTFIDEKQNQIIYIFLDKDSNKRYFIESFVYEFFLSKEFNVINNDYFESYDNEKFIKYTVYSFWDYQRLRSEINKNYKRIING